MKNIDLFNAVSGVDESIIERSFNALKKKKSHRVGIWIAAACIMLFVIGTFSFAAAAEAKEYSEAVDFFEANGLDTEGLSRSDIKAVYRDITQEHFTYGKTAEVIKKSVGGWEIEQDEPTPEELAEGWKKSSDLSAYLRSNGISYMKDFIYEDSGDDVKHNPDKSLLKCYRDKELVWTAGFENCWIEGWRKCEGCTAVWGYINSYIPTSEEGIYDVKVSGWVACVDYSGNALWKNELAHDFFHEDTRSAIRNADGTWTVFGYGIDYDDNRYICITVFDKNGTQTSFCKTETEYSDVFQWRTVLLGDEYLVQLTDKTAHQTASFIRIDAQGNISDNYSYSGETCEYCITDMTEFGGNIYLSAYSYPKAEDAGGRHEIARLLEYAGEKSESGDKLTSEEFTPIVRENFTAVLLICDTETGNTETFYEVKGSFGGSLTVTDDGMLEWEVKSITSAEYHPTINAYSINGRCKVFGYTFGTDGRLRERTDIGRYETFYR